MIERDGWCYPDDPQPMLQIVAADRLGDYRLMVTFNDGEKRIFDGHSLLKGPVFAPLADEKVFNDYALDYETLTWLNGEVDIAPEFVYEHSEKV